MAATTTTHSASSWEAKFTATFDAICAAFWSRLEARQAERILTVPLVPTVPPGPGVTMGAVPVKQPHKRETACGMENPQDVNPFKGAGGAGGSQAPARRPTRVRRAERMMERRSIDPYKNTVLHAPEGLLTQRGCWSRNTKQTMEKCRIGSQKKPACGIG
ncbi:Hypothetical predicted protein [Pelobates cultripes]|uniref:Uncharacterized protein n=1 Tax=Pelobates cultripes TaxID=61616 RepID=A0AAD1W8V3_PELCU|nr:Hypothetical predicted protein [Pelobates cultripes]